MQVISHFSTFADLSKVPDTFSPLSEVGSRPESCTVVVGVELVCCSDFKTACKYTVGSNKFENQMIDLMNKLDEIFYSKYLFESSVASVVYGATVNYGNILKKSSGILASVGFNQFAIPQIQNSYRNWFRACLIAEYLNVNEFHGFSFDALKYLIARCRLPCRFNKGKELWYY